MSTNSASLITKTASKQTYYTIRFLVDRDRVDDAYRAYGYFRWVDDILDADPSSGSMLSAVEASEPKAFLERQKSLLETSYRDEVPRDINIQEKMLVELVQHDHEKNSGLQSYLRNMMRVLDFDAKRRGKLVSQAELNEYTRWLATSVTDGLHYFIGHSQPSPQNRSRYLAVTGAHITHMLRDTREDIQAGYFNIPREYLAATRIGPQDVESEPYRVWVRERADLARAYFKSGKEYLSQVGNIRRRIAGYAYIARFEMVLDVIERLNYQLIPEYVQGNGWGTGMRMSGSVLSLTFFPPVQK